MRSHQVWIVDDSPLEAERIRRTLAASYGTEVFHDGTALLERLASAAPPDAIVLDWIMPGLSGLDVCKFVRAPLGGLDALAILLLTAQRGTEHIVEGLSAGADDFLCKPFADEELLARVGALVRSRERIEQAELADALTRRLLVGSPDPLIAVDAAGTLRFANGEASLALGAPAEALVGCSVAALIPELATVDLTDASRAGGLPDVHLRGRVYAPAIRVRPTAPGSSAVIALRDVTERRRADTRRLDVYTVVAHDLRAPLSAMAMRLELMRRGKHGRLPASLLADADRMDASIRSLVAMIDDFLSLARLEGTGYRLERTELDVVELVDRVMEEVGPLLEAGRLEWVRVAPDAPVTLRADGRRLTQVVTNLVGNAIKFTPAGGRITTRIEAMASHVHVAIEDTGRGIPGPDRAGLWERYTRASEVEHVVGGSGLGLMIVREIVHAHGGSVGVESEPGRGSAFWFRLPTAPRAAAEGAV